MLKTKELVSPFSREYFEQELQSFKIKPKKYKNIEVQTLPLLEGRIDGFMYKAFLGGSTALIDIPAFYIDGKIWMSLTPMEIESHYLPLQFAKGRVGVAGLGLGYYVQRILDREDVKEVVVYEINQDVVDFYFENFGKHPKLIIKNENFHDVKKEKFDFFYCDIYPEQMPESGISDMVSFTGRNKVGHYHFWTQETLAMAMLQAGIKDFIQTWKKPYVKFIVDLLDKHGNMLINIYGGDHIYDELQEHDLV